VFLVYCSCELLEILGIISGSKCILKFKSISKYF
jgi:hypothetical protein